MSVSQKNLVFLIKKYFYLKKYTVPLKFKYWTFGETTMKTLSVVIISFALVSSQSFAGGDCASKSAAFDSKIKKAIEVASFSDETVLKLKKLKIL